MRNDCDLQARSTMTNEVPIEDHEAYCLADWLFLKGYKFTHIANESGQRGTGNIIAMMNKKKKLGVDPGFLDYCIVLKR